MDMESETDRKQNLLVTEIIDPGYDPMAFQVYCETIKENGSQDLDLWTYDELAKTVKDFKQKEDAKQNAAKNQSEQIQRPSQTLTQSQMQYDNNNQFKVQKNLDDVNFLTEVECQLPQRTALTDYILENTHKQVEIIMNEFMTKSEGIFSSGYGAFKVETKPIGWCVWRRFSDFLKLREILQKAFPQHLIPPIPSKKLKAKTDNEYLEKRMRVMELFLQNCLYHPLFKTHPALSDFLSLTDEVKLKDKVQLYDKMKGPNKPSEYTMVNGVCVLEMSQELNTYSNTLQDYLKNSTEIYKKLGANFKKLMIDLSNLSASLQSITDGFNALDKITENFIKINQNRTQGEILQIQQVYQELSKFMTGWQNGIGFQTKNVKENFYEFFRYHKKMQRQTYEYLQNKNQLQQKFNEMKNKLYEKKDKLFIQSDPTKWELPPDIPKTIKEIQVSKGDAFKYMLPNETKVVNDMRDTVAFMNHQLVDEVNQMMSFRIMVYARKFIRMGQMKALETAKLHHVLANFLQVLHELQGNSSGQMCNRRSSVFIDNRYDQFFGIKAK